MQGSGGRLADTDPAFGQLNEDAAKGPSSGLADTMPRAGTRTRVKAHVSCGEGADFGRGTGADPLMVLTAIDTIDVLPDQVKVEAARLEVGELPASETSGKSS